ncbi:hypothetical protein L210DRAFT_3552168, partial [Boletus edulis BED1]
MRDEPNVRRIIFREWCNKPARCIDKDRTRRPERGQAGHQTKSKRPQLGHRDIQQL